MEEVDIETGNRRLHILNNVISHLIFFIFRRLISRCLKSLSIARLVDYWVDEEKKNAFSKKIYDLLF